MSKLFKHCSSKTTENKNGKNKECENGMEESQAKTKRKRRSFWSKWSALFSRSSSSTAVKDDRQQIEHEKQNPQITVNTDMERWGQEESIDGNSQMLSIPIEPGRQVSTIILSPTKTGFKAVIAHYGLNATLTQSLTKDIAPVTGPLENRRTLTVVFDMNSTTFDDAPVGKTAASVSETNQKENGDNKKMSASALFVRTVTNNIVESAAFLQAQLSIENTRPPLSHLPEEMIANTDRRQMSRRRSFQTPRIAFRTISEPLWRDKQKMQRETIMKQNIQEVLNQFIFLDREDSFMNYTRLYGEKDRARRNELKDNDDTYAVEILRAEEETMRPIPFISSMTSTDRLSDITSSSGRNVSPDLLVNIKPFKEYVTNRQKLDFLKEKPILRSERIGFLAKRPVMMLGPPVQKNIPENSMKPKEYIQEADEKFDRPLNKSRVSQCIKCGMKVKGDESRFPKEPMGRGIYRMRDGDYMSDLACKKKNSLKLISKGKEECNFCSTWKLYNKASFTTANLKSDSVEDILKELEGSDHNSIFKQNISQFKTKIKTRNSPIEFKTSRSSLSFAEVIELEEGKLTCMKNSKASEIPADFPNVTLRLIEFVRKTGDKTVQFERIKKSMEKLELEDVVTPSGAVQVMENSCFMLLFPDCNYVIKVMAQKIEEKISMTLANIGGEFMPEETVQFMFTAYTSHTPKTDGTKLTPDNKLEDYRGSFSKISGQIPDLISHLWMDKIDDLRNELISRMNETRMSYDPNSYHSAQLIRLKGRQKSTGRCSVATTTPHIFNTGGDANTCSSFDSRCSGKSERSEDDVMDGQSAIDKSPEEPSTITKVTNGKLMENQEKSTELHSEDLQSAGPNDQIISFTNPDFKIHSCLMFFVPFVHQIQTAVEILNSTVYSFPVRKVEDQIDRNCLRILRSCNMLSDKKKYFIDNELESLVMKKCVEKNVVSGMTTSTKSKKEIMTIKGSRSGNHLLVTNKKILTTNDKIKKSEVLTGGIEDDGNDGGEKNVNVLLRNVSEHSEDLNGVQCLYYKKTNGNEMRESSEESNYSDGKVSESQSSVIAISDLEDSTRRSDRTPANDSEAFTYVQPTTEDEMSNPNIANDSLQETERATPGKLSRMKSLSVNLLQKITPDSADEGEVSGGPGSLSSVDEKARPSASQIESVKVTEEKLIINEAKESRMLVHEKVKASGDKIIKKTDEGALTQRLIAQRVGGKIVICRGDNYSPSDEPSESKRMSVVVTLARQMPERKAPSRCQAKDSRKRGLHKTVEAKSPVPNQFDIPKDHGGPPKTRSGIPKRHQETSYSAIPRKR